MRATTRTRTDLLGTRTDLRTTKGLLKPCHGRSPGAVTLGRGALAVFDLMTTFTGSAGRPSVNTIRSQSYS